MNYDLSYEISLKNRPERTTYFNSRHRLGLKYYNKLIRPVRTALLRLSNEEAEKAAHKNKINTYNQ